MNLAFVADNVTVYFLKDIMHSKKKYLLNDQIQKYFVPGYENLTLKCIGEFVQHHPEVHHYLPDQPDLGKTPKQWIVNVCAAVIGADFKHWVQDQIEERNAIMAEKKEIMISMDPVMAEKFAASTHVSRK